MQTDKELEKAIELHKKGLKNDALSIYRRIVKHDPCHADSWHLMGLIAFDENNNDEAEYLIRKAIALMPDCVLFHTNLGLILSVKGEYEQSLAEYLNALQLDEGCHEACYRAALIYQNLGNKELAFTYYEKALAINLNHAETWNNLGNLAMDSGRTDDALIFFNKAITFKPDYAESYNNLGCLFSKLNKLDKAIPLFMKALTIIPDFDEALNNLGNCYKKKRQWNLAIECCSRARMIRPDSVELCFGLADALRSAGDTDKALELFIETTTMDNDNGRAFKNIVSILNARCAWEQCRPYQQRLISLTKKALEENKPCPESAFNCLGRYPDKRYEKDITAAASREIQESTEKLGLHFSFDNKIRKKYPITLGYLSNNVKNHANAHLVLGLFKIHDRCRFKVNVYSYGENDGSYYRKKIEQDADSFWDIQDLSYVEAAQKIFEDGVDILIDLTGYTLGSMMEIPALRPAPIQVRYLGFPGSMQATFFDYFITDRIMTPPEDQINYTEKFVYMPQCYQINDRDQPVAATVYTRKDFNLPESAFVFCSFNSSYKIEKVMFGIWMEILKSVDDSVLWLLRENEHMEKNLKAEAVKCGVNENRLIFSDKMAKEEHLARLKLADLALDTRLVSGHITTSDALWAGVPVITKMGDHFISRAPASILTHIGLPELVVNSLDEYKELAVSLAKDADRLKQIKEKLIKNRETAPLFDTKRFVRNYEKALSAMWETFKAGKKPEQIQVVEDREEGNG